VKLRLALVALVVAELLAVLWLWLPWRSAESRLGQAVTPGIEERHFITLIVRDPEGRTVSRTFETRSFVHTSFLLCRMFAFWRFDPGFRQYISQIHHVGASRALDASGYPQSFGTDGHIDRQNAVFPSSLVFLGSSVSADGGRTLGNPLGAGSMPSVSYSYNDLWFNVTVTATFSFSQDTTVSEAMLAVVDESWDPPPGFYSLVYDSFPAVDVPAGGSLTVQWVFAWKDHGAFTENWGKLWQYALTLNAGSERPYVTFVDSSGASVAIPWPNAVDVPQGRIAAGDLAWGTGTSPMSRSSYRLQSEAGSAQVGFSIVGTGFSLGGAVGGQASEVGLYWLAYDASGNLHRILLMRWVPGYALPAGTPLNIYVARGG
jgi:hypothetical protein